ncbi:PH domain-containing protein [Sphingomonas sp.]|uniref:PH domain-containing protein n=1 Tax=Sphingomonas sp. TaxID=28214 RepID=UPI002DEC67BB|nr:PH domain-containing protein [Sphingomonas sp.]
MEQTIIRFRPSTSRWLVGSFAGWTSLILCAVGVGVVLIAMRWWRNVGSRYELTDQRLRLRLGIIFQKEDEIELFRIRELGMDCSLLNRMAGIGTISIRSTDATTHRAPYYLPDIPAASEIRETMRTLVNRSRGRNRVREVETGGAF